MATVRLEEDGGRDLSVEARLLHLWCAFGIEAQRVSVFLSGDVRRHGRFETLLTELIEDGRPKQCTFERRRSE
ncbi:MAG: hypothetical protein ACKV2T_37915 [Kofleriaceae bacterium]